MLQRGTQVELAMRINDLQTLTNDVVEATATPSSSTPTKAPTPNSADNDRHISAKVTRRLQLAQCRNEGYSTVMLPCSLLTMRGDVVLSGTVSLTVFPAVFISRLLLPASGRRR